MMRKVFLFASTNPWLRGKAMRTAFVQRSVKKFMPGEHASDAIAAAVGLKAAGISTILTHLGENISHLREADEVAQHYLDLLKSISSANIDAQISIKPTQLGFDQDPSVCLTHCARLLDASEKQKTFFWLDMESSPYVDGTISLYKELRRRSPFVGIAIQAYLRRSPKDVEDLVKLGSAIRLVKGAYLEPSAIAFPKKSDVDEQYFRLATRLLQPDADKPGALLHIATHDVGLQGRLRQVISERKVPATRYEYAMLYGINSARQQQLASRGDRIRCLISYGEYWFPWYMRRLAERPANVWFVVRNMWG
jgi:proline dehydrogenase